MLNVYASLITACIVATVSVANATSIQRDESANVVAKIYYSGNVTIMSVSRLVSVFDEINKNQDIKNIYLYINSYGGDMDAGLMASAVIKSSKIPVTTVAMSTVGSSATLMFCAANDRRSLTDGYIYLHPAFVSYNGNMRPDDIQEMSDDSKRFNSMFKRTYENCTNLTDDAIDKILYRETNKITYTPDEAKKVNLISAIDDKIIAAEKTYYVTDNSSGS